jgi:ATP synthase F1 delta subunit
MGIEDPIDPISSHLTRDLVPKCRFSLRTPPLDMSPLTNMAPRLLRRPLVMRRLLSTAELPMEPPVVMFGIAGRYANALYAAAAKKSELLDVESDLKLLKETLDMSPMLRNFVIDPSISRSQKATGVASIMDAANASTSTKNAMSALAEGGRMGDIFKVIDMYSDLLTAAKGEVKAVVTSAKPLASSEISEINEKLKNLLVIPPTSPLYDVLWACSGVCSGWR